MNWNQWKLPVCSGFDSFDKRKMHWQVVNNFGVTAPATCHHLSLELWKSKFLRGNYQLGSVRTRSNGRPGCCCSTARCPTQSSVALLLALLKQKIGLESMMDSAKFSFENVGSLRSGLLACLLFLTLARHDGRADYAWHCSVFENREINQLRFYTLFLKKSNFSQINLLTFLMSCILHHYLVTLKTMTNTKEKADKTDILKNPRNSATFVGKKIDS